MEENSDVLFIWLASPGQRNRGPRESYVDLLSGGIALYGLQVCCSLHFFCLFLVFGSHLVVLRLSLCSGITPGAWQTICSARL